MKLRSRPRGFERGDEAGGEERTGEFFFGERTGGGAHGASSIDVGSERLERVGEGSDIARRDDDAAAMLRD